MDLAQSLSAKIRMDLTMLSNHNDDKVDAEKPTIEKRDEQSNETLYQCV